MSGRVLASLPDGPVDIVGDVHGEVEALDALVAGLGYDQDGRHPQRRRLVFVGDLVDRGPSSPGVLARVIRYARRGGAAAILGNHEMNLLRGARREGNAWFTAPDAPMRYPAEKATPEQRREILGFLSTLPLALERGDLRIVHACWDDAALERVEKFSDVAEAYRAFESEVRTECSARGLDALAARELDERRPRLDDPGVRPPFLPARAELETLFQLGNPVRVLTSGLEAPVPAPFWASGRWRMVGRTRWWDAYDHPKPVIIGHYWRRYAETQAFAGDRDAEDVFDGIEPHQWMGKRANVYCVDFSVGGRPEERSLGGAPPFICKLAALRVPEWQVVHDDGEIWDIGPPGMR